MLNTEFNYSNKISNTESKQNLASLFDEREIQRHIDALELDKAQITFQRFPDKKLSPNGFAQTQIGPLADHMKWIRMSNLDQKCTISIMTNPAKGAKQTDVIRVINVFADDDTKREKPRTDWPLKPHLIVETSPGKYHYYWRIVLDCLTAKELGRLQGKIARDFDTDKSLCDYSKKARLAGTVHMKNEPFTTRITDIGTHPKYSRAELIEAFGDFTTVSRQAKTSNVVQFEQRGWVGRNDHLYRKLCGARGQGLEELELEQLANEINGSFDSPLDESEVMSTVQSALSHEPNPIPFPLTEAGSAERFAARFGETVGYSHTRKAWFIYDGQIWKQDRRGQVTQFAIEVARSLLAEAALITDAEVRDATIKFARRSESSKAIKAVLDLAGAQIPLDLDNFDADDFGLNVKNGYLNLRTRLLRPHKPDQFCFKMAGCEFIADAKAPAWDAFIADITCGDSELARYLQRFAGRILTADCSVHALTFLFGRGRNGKSVFAKVLQNLLGSYATTLQAEFFMEGSKNATLETLDLRGVRLAVCSELPANGKLSEGRLKSLTGQDIVKARGLYQDFQTFEPTAKFLLLSNHKPYIRNGGDALWSRLHLFPCDFIASGHKLDPNLMSKLLDELPGILNWALAGLHDKSSYGEELPQRMQQELAEYRQSEDSVGLFLEDCCSIENVNKTMFVTNADLYRTYQRWAAESGAFALSAIGLTKNLSERGIRGGRKSVARGYYGLALK